MCAFIRRRSKTPPFQPTGDLVDIPSVPFPGRSEYRLPISLPGRVKRDLAEFKPNVVHVSSPDFVSAPRGDLGPAQQGRSSRLGPHAVRDLLCLLSSPVDRARGAQHHAPALPPLRGGDGAGRIDRGDPSRAAHEPRHRDLVARDRPRPVQPRPARPGVAPLHRHRRR